MSFEFAEQAGAEALAALLRQIGVPSTLTEDPHAPYLRLDRDGWDGGEHRTADWRPVWRVEIPDAAVADAALESRIRYAAHQAGCHAL